MTGLNDIRKTFIKYFESIGHQPVSSSPLVPSNDPTLMFTNAGMVQFKNVFTGVESRDYQRAVTSQKCVRAGGKHNDLDNVGYTARHHTFFEMLGNFSFGDYFKDDAIPFAWDLLTKEFGLKKEHLLVTVYHDDIEAANIWKKYAGLSDDRIIPIATSDNFWSMGPTGPCGPCSEIFYDHGPKIWGGPPGSKDEDGDRFIEIWNLVFMQFEQFSEGKREALPKPSIDTGMGLERIGAVLQGQHDNYETDTMRKIIEASALATGVEAYGKRNVHHRVIADHLRSTCFLIAEGVLPSNEGRGYVLRRIMRRAMRHIHLLGKQDNIMHLLVESLVQEMGQAFPELVNAKSIMEETLFMEEKRFKETLDRGLFLLENEIKFIPDGGTLPGEIAFKLYDTFGFPLDLTQDALREQGYKVDTDGFTSAMNSQKEKARAAWVGSGDKQDSIIWFQYAKKFQQTEFLGYETPVAQGKVLVVLVDGVQSSVAIKGQKANVIFNQTPFYAESGGQVSDSGTFRSESGHGLVSQVMKKEGFFVHSIEVLDGTLELETGVELKVDELLRNSISSNHSATHLMHECLRGILGDHVAQRGSLNDSKRIRFDFSHGKPLTEIELEEVESQVNAYIRQNTEVSTRLMTPDEARELGARALFGEKYGDEVRVVSMGVKNNSGLGGSGNTFSLELCGGTHVKRTGDIGSFKIVSETASASGVRRIEGCTGEQVAKLVFHQERTLRNVSNLLKTNINDIIYRLEALFEDKKNLQLQISNMKKKLALRSESIGSTYAEKIKISNVSFVGKILHDVENNSLREIIDTQKKDIISGIILLVNVSSSKVNLICGITPDLTSQFSAVDIVKEASKATGGKGGGGRPDMAQAGGLDPNKAADAIEVAKAFILSQALN